jgi:Domain of unknown function (DUF3391)
MLKKINVRDARLGMYLQEVCGSWMEHPFWKKSFELANPKDLVTLMECGIQEIWIDTDKGLDVEAAGTTLSKAEAEHNIDQKLQQAAASNANSTASVTMHEESRPCFRKPAWVKRWNLKKSARWWMTSAFLLHAIPKHF